MGGGITIATIENYPDAYHGALALCPLSKPTLSAMQKRIRYVCHLQWIISGHYKSLHEIFDLAKTVYGPGCSQNDYQSQWNKTAMFAKDSLLAIAFAKRFDLKVGDLPFALFLMKMYWEILLSKREVIHLIIWIQFIQVSLMTWK